MDQDTLNYIFIGLSFALYIGIAFKSRASSTKEYYTAGGGVSPHQSAQRRALARSFWLRVRERDCSVAGAGVREGLSR